MSPRNTAKTDTIHRPRRGETAPNDDGTANMTVRRMAKSVWAYINSASPMSCVFQDAILAKKTIRIATTSSIFRP